jgi:glycosyltransferase involved in cell wall biosynthesis
VLGRSRIGGVERWAREVLVRLADTQPDRYELVTPPRGLAHRAGQLWEQLALPALAARRGARVIVSPANLAPLAWPRNVVVIHDAAALRHPEWFSRGYAAWHRVATRAVARRAELVITVSEFSRSELLALTDVSPERIAVVPGGVADDFAAAADPERARRALGLDRPYVLAVATPSVRKNLAVLDRAVRDLGAAGIELVTAGAGRDYLPRADAVPVRSLGYVEEALLPGLYAGALATVVPSRYEGFGLPCLESMAAGTPVVAARAGGLIEACGDAALLVDPDDPAGFSTALVRAATDEAARERLIAAGLLRSRSLSWRTSADALDALVDSHRPQTATSSPL